MGKKKVMERFFDASGTEAWAVWKRAGEECIIISKIPNNKSFNEMGD